jgi:hypothetical protein
MCRIGIIILHQVIFALFQAAASKANGWHTMVGHGD